MTTTTLRHPEVTAWLEHLERIGDSNPNCVCLGDGHRTPGCPQHPQAGER